MSWGPKIYCEMFFTMIQCASLVVDKSEVQSFFWPKESGCSKTIVSFNFYRDQIKDEMEQLKAFNESFLRIAALNFDLIVDSVASVSGIGEAGEKFSVTDPKLIREFLENCETVIGKTIEEKITNMNKIGVNKNVQLECEEHGPFAQEVGFDPVNFFTAS